MNLTVPPLSAVGRWLTRRRLIRDHPTLTIEPHVVIKGHLANLRIGTNVIVQSGCVLHLGGMDWCHGLGRLELGDGTCISPNCVIYGCGPGGVSIGKRFDCGPGVGIFASRTNYAQPGSEAIFAPVVIGDDVVVFAHAVISPGVTIGSGAVVAANSVVLQDVPAGCLVAGSPARVVNSVIAKRIRSEANGPDPSRSSQDSLPAN